MKKKEEGTALILVLLVVAIVFAACSKGEDEVVVPTAINGCTDSLATNYNPLATSSIAFGGILDPNIGSGGYYNGNRYLIFDAFEDAFDKLHIAMMAHMQIPSTIVGRLSQI